MYGALQNASLARIPAKALGLLGRLRVYASVQVRGDGANIWVRWDEAGFEVLRAMLPVEGTQFYERLDGKWHLCGHSLPAFDIPEDNYHSLARALVPGPQQTFADVEEPTPRVVLALKRSAIQRPASALLCSDKTLAAWADMALSRVIAGLRAARSESRVLLTGQLLPPISGERFWGERLLCPLGWEPDPPLPESALMEALGAKDTELVLMRGADVEVIPRQAFAPLTRASARLVVA